MRDRQRGSVSTGIVMPICVGATLFALITWLGFHTPASSRWHSWTRWPWWAEALSVLAVLASFMAMAVIDEARRGPKVKLEELPPPGQESGDKKV